VKEGNELAMNIVFSSDDNYMGLLAASMLSLLENKDEDDDIQLFVFDDNIKEESKKQMDAMLEPYGQKITYMRVPTEKELIGRTLPTQRWSTTMILRLFVGSIFPEDIERIIFLDCDVLVLGSLKELWETELKGHYIGGVLECSGNARKRNLGLKPDATYINAGVEIIDLKALRESDAEERYRKFLCENSGYIPEVEQGTVNACISQWILPIHPKWNAHTTFFMFDYDTQRRIKRPTVYPSREEVREAVEKPMIVHFSGCCYSDIRPWLEEGKSEHPYAQGFMEYKKRTPWNEPLYMGDNRSRVKRICNWAYRKLPRWMYAFVASVGYLHIIPRQEARKMRK
jgi:lipopolysaccharide biosynthesis glycosyltransferase